MRKLAGKFGVSTRKVASTLAVVTATGRLARVNQNGKFRHCMPEIIYQQSESCIGSGNHGKAFLSQPVLRYRYRKLQTQEDIKTETVADMVQSLPSLTETQGDDLILPSLHIANRELRRAKSHVQKWERLRPRCGAEQVPGYYTADELFQRGCEVRWRGWVAG
ncbi:DUF1627 domain-containing protein [Escherichia coli]|uniref:DUF1627 domain-containing protein n=1 Tax=Escherichia coli TaxID=562 RepID=UPI002FCCFF52